MVKPASLDNLRDLYVAELVELRSAEEMMSETMGALGEHAQDDELARALKDDVSETRRHAERIDALIERHGGRPGESRDQAMAAMLSEARKWADMIDRSECRDAALIASVQRVQHYEIAVYGSLATWAKQLGHEDDLSVLLEILEEEKRADEKLTQLAKRAVNPKAS